MERRASQSKQLAGWKRLPPGRKARNLTQRLAFMTWNEAVEDPVLEGLPYKIELNCDGNIIMSPTLNPHGIRQLRIGNLLTQMLPNGLAATEMAVQTSDNVKVTDVAWFTIELARIIANEDVCSKAPTICVEIASKSNYQRELDEKKSLHFEAGAEEVWICDQAGRMTYYTLVGQVTASPRCPNFPATISGTI